MLAREAVELAQVTDFVNHRADALLDLSQVLKASRRMTGVSPSPRSAASVRAQGEYSCCGRNSSRLGELART